MKCGVFNAFFSLSMEKPILHWRILNWINIIINNLMMQRITNNVFFPFILLNIMFEVWIVWRLNFFYKLTILYVVFQRFSLTIACKLWRSSPNCNRIFRIFHVIQMFYSFHSLVILSIVHSKTTKQDFNDRIKTFFNSSLHWAIVLKWHNTHKCIPYFRMREKNRPTFLWLSVAFLKKTKTKTTI